jgi:hypothetical protein
MTHYNHSTLLGTVSGTVLTVIVNLDLQDITKTAVLAAVGAVVSFVVSVSLKWIVRRLNKK